MFLEVVACENDGVVSQQPGTTVERALHFVSPRSKSGAVASVRVFTRFRWRGLFVPRSDPPDAYAGMVYGTRPASRSRVDLWTPCVVRSGLRFAASEAPIVAGAAMVALGVYVGLVRGGRAVPGVDALIERIPSP